MKNKTISILLILNLITTIGMLNFFIKGKVSKEKEILKEMTESEQVSGMQTQINTLNESHEEYARNVQSYKRQIASAITDMGIETEETADATTMSSNIRSLTGTSSADKVSYDNTDSGLAATNVQGAVDELNDNLGNLPDYNNAVSLENNITSYTALEDGYISTILETSGATNTIYTTNVKINNIVVAQLSVYSPVGIIQSFLFPISKGETANWFYESSSCKSYNNMFIPFK